MLRKLLRYDFKSINKFWIIAAVTTVGLSIISGFFMRLENTGRELPTHIHISATFFTVSVILGFFAFALITAILIFRRFYKNFFTDEGYLTFTLPVKRTELLNSKMIFGTVAYFATALIIVFDILLMIKISTGDAIFNEELWLSIKDPIMLAVSEKGVAYVIASILTVIIEILAIIITAIVVSVLFMYFCVTVASIIAKKAKVFTAIGIYYATNSFLSFFMMMFMFFGLESLMTWIYNADEKYEVIIPILILLMIGLSLAIIATLLYILIFRLLDRKLNLT